MVHERPPKYEEAIWEKMNRNACGVIRSCLEEELKYDMIGGDVCNEDVKNSQQ